MNIIQTWKEKGVPPVVFPFVEKMRDLNSNCSHSLFADEDIINFIKRRMPEYFDTFTRLKYKIQQIDFFRYLAIYYYGGVYLDLDMEMTLPFDDLDLTKCTFPVETKKEDFKLLGNYAFYAPRNDPFIKHIIDCIVNNEIKEEEIKQEEHTDDVKQVYVYYTTGPVLLTNAYKSYKNREDILLLEPEPYKENCFGKYGFHNCYGFWKHKDKKLDNSIKS
jgi:mannosyltransferase OCH1-like enzyme